MSIEKNFSLSSVENDLSHRKMEDWWYYSKKVLRDRRFSVSVGELCSFAGLDISHFSDRVKAILKRRVRQVSAVQPTFVSHSICVQMYDDTADDMRWAIKNGAIAVVTTEQIDDLPCIVADFPPLIYARMCRFFRDLRDVSVTVVTGSIGKTTVKRMINEVYSQQFETFCNTINYNALYHAGYYVQHIPSDTRLMVQEVSEDTPGYVNPMSICLKPRIACITTVTCSHIEAFGSEEEIKKEVCSIVSGMDEKGIVLVEKDAFMDFQLLKGKTVLTVSPSNPMADFYARSIQVTGDGLSFIMVDKQTQTECPVMLRSIYALHNVTCALFAFACGVLESVAYENIVKGIESFRMLGMRQNIFTVQENVLCYADCFNAIPLSVKSAMEAAESIPILGKRIAVLGDIGETGNLSESIHREIVEIINNSAFDKVIIYGSNLQRAWATFGKLRDGMQLYVCDTHDSIVQTVKDIISSGDLILFKASHSAELRQVISKLWPKEYYRVNHDERDPYNRWIEQVRRN